MRQHSPSLPQKPEPHEPPRPPHAPQHSAPRFMSRGGSDGGGGGSDGGGGEGARMTNCETTGSVAPSTVTPTAALSAVKLLARPCIVSATLPAADASEKTMVAFTLTLAALTLRLMSAGDTLR